MNGRAGLSWMVLRLWQGLAFFVLLLLAGSSLWGSRTGEQDFEAFFRDTTRQWCAAHGKRDDLQAVVVDVRFRAEPPLFKQGEGAVVAPLAIDLPDAQRVLEVASMPAHLRKLTTPRITALAWEYGGRLHRTLPFRGMALVERAPLTRVTLPPAPTFRNLAADLRPEASARAADLDEHGLAKCAGFNAWAVKSAGEPPHTAQLERLVRAVANRAEEDKRAEDLCADMRAGRFTPHRAQVAAVLGAREVGVPAFGFAAAAGAKSHLVGTFVDGMGWIYLDVERPADGWFSGGPPLLTMAPVLGGFSATRHDFWSPEAGAYANEQWGVTAVSTTQWQAPLATGTRTNSTEARAISLAEACR